MRHASILVVALIACGTYGEDATEPAPPPERPAADDPRADAIKVAPDGRDFAEGTDDAPVATFARAMALATERGTDVVACAGTYVENVVIARPVRVFGDRSCTDWKPTDARARIAPEEGIPLTIRSSDVRIDGVDVVATAVHFIPSLSAVGVFVTSSSRVALQNMNIKSGIATAGVDAGPAPSNRLATPVAGGNGNATMRGIGPRCTCADMSWSKGGDGAGSDITQQPTSGTANPTSADFASNAGVSTSSGCTPGGKGASARAAPAGAAMTKPLDVDANRVVPSIPSDGVAGAPGQGGGGGGEHYGYTTGGGGGGCGGCGGSGGRGGASGGSSIAVLSFESEITIASSDLSAADGADGGAGSAAEAGGVGAIGGTGACMGGDGGRGGSGSGGGGGAGGSSAAVFYVGARPSVIETRASFGRAGRGGAAGKGGAPDGADGKPGTDGIAGEIVTY